MIYQISNGSYLITFGNYLIVFGNYQMSNGSYQIVFGNYQMSNGSYQIAFGNYKIDVGSYQIAFGNYQIVFGNYKTEKCSYIFWNVVIIIVMFIRILKATNITLRWSGIVWSVIRLATKMSLLRSLWKTTDSGRQTADEWKMRIEQWKMNNEHTSIRAFWAFEHSSILKIGRRPTAAGLGCGLGGAGTPMLIS